MKTTGMILGAIGALTCTTGVALAGPIAVDFRGTALGRSASVTFQSGDSAAFTNRNLFVGQLIHRLGTGASAKDFITYCIDLTQSAGDGTFNLTSLNNAPVTSPAPSSKWELGHAQIDALNSLYNADADSVNTNARAAAFQAAIWEIVFDWESVDGGTFSSGDTSNMLGGRVRINNNVSNSLYAGYLTSAVAGLDTSGRLAAITSESRQDQLVVIPLPGAGALAGAGMLMVATRRRRSI